MPGRIELVLTERTPIESSPLQQVALAVVMGDEGHPLARRHRCGSTDYVRCVSWHDLLSTRSHRVQWGDDPADRWLPGVPARVAAVAGPHEKPLGNQHIQSLVAQLVRQVPQTLRLPERQLQPRHLRVFQPNEFRRVLDLHACHDRLPSHRSVHGVNVRTQCRRSM